MYTQVHYSWTLPEFIPQEAVDTESLCPGELTSEPIDRSHKKRRARVAGYQSLESLVFWSLLGGAGGGPLRRVA